MPEKNKMVFKEYFFSAEHWTIVRMHIILLYANLFKEYIKKNYT